MAQDPVSPFTHLLIFQLVGNDYAIPLQGVREVLRMVAITPLPLAHEWLVGIINLRGEIIPILDLRKRLALTAHPYSLNTPIIVAQHKDSTFGLIADGVSPELTVAPNAIVQTDSFVDADHTIGCIARVNERLIAILDLSRMMVGSEDVLTA